MAEAARSETGTIYDIGYQHYEGERLGRPYAIRSLFTHGVGTVFAVNRGARARLVPLVLGALALLPAVIQASVAAFTNNLIELITYSNYFLNLSMIFALFCAAQAPELVSADQRTRTLVLYLARALRRDDYVLARVFALAAGVFGLTMAPLLVLLSGRVFAAAEPWAAFKTEAVELAPIFGSSVMVALLMAAVSVAIASFTRRRGIAAAAVLGYFILAAAVTTILREAIEREWDVWLALLNPFVALGGFANWVFDSSPARGSPLWGVDLPGWAFGVACLAYVALAMAALFARYRRIGA